MSSEYKVNDNELIKNTGNYLDNACVWTSGNNSNIVDMVREGIENPTQWYEKNYRNGDYEVDLRVQVTKTEWRSMKAYLAGVSDDVEPHGTLLAVKLGVYAIDYKVGEAYNICDGTYTVVAE